MTEINPFDLTPEQKKQLQRALAQNPSHIRAEWANVISWLNDMRKVGLKAVQKARRARAHAEAQLVKVQTVLGVESEDVVAELAKLRTENQAMRDTLSAGAAIVDLILDQRQAEAEEEPEKK